MGTTCSCVGPCDKPSCFSNLKYKLQYTAENRRQKRQCPCTNRRPKCLRRRRRRRNPFCDCEEIEMHPQRNHIFQDCECPLHSEPAVKTPPPQQKTIVRCRSRSISPTPQINVFPCNAQTNPNLRASVPGCQGRPPTPATKDAYTCTDVEETPPSEPSSPRPYKCLRSKPQTPVCPKKTISTYTNTEEEDPPSEPPSPRYRFPRSKPASPVYPKKAYSGTAETETPLYEPPSFVQKTCIRSKPHTAMCPRRITTKSACIQVERPAVITRSPGVSRSPSPTCNKETCPFLNGHLTRSPSPENTQNMCIFTNSIQEDGSNNMADKNLKNICRFTVDAYFI